MLDFPEPSWPRLHERTLQAIAARAADVDAGQATLQADLDELSALGLRTRSLPQSHAMASDPASVTGLFDTLRALGRANLSVARLFEGHVNACALLRAHADPACRKRATATVRDGGWLGVWGADGPRPVTFDGTRLHGSKRFASGIGHLAGAIVIARGEGDAGPRMVLAPVADASRGDVSGWNVGGMRGTASGTYDFDGVSGIEIGTAGDYLREPHFEGGVWRYCAAHLGAAEGLVDALVETLRRQGRDDDPHQAARIADAARLCETVRLFVREAALRVEAGTTDPEGAAAYALLAREQTEEGCLSILALVDRALGTQGHASGSYVERTRRDLGLFLRQANPDGKRAAAAAALAAGAGRAEFL